MEFQSNVLDDICHNVFVFAKFIVMLTVLTVTDENNLAI